MLVLVIFLMPYMARQFGSGLIAIPNLFRDLDSRFREFGFKAHPVGGVLYYLKCIDI